jgi:serine/threonine protein phosphatase PrpC
MSKFLQNISFLNDNFKRSIHTKITDAFLLTNHELIEETDINCFFNGSTCVSVIYTPERLICPNIGDSRAVLGRNINNEWRAIELPRDHKPTEPDEELRIREHNGRI